jgi:3-hydroxybutyryl-CoA dehydrogenase
MKDFANDPLKIAVIGAGVMGRGIAQLAAAAGIKVVLHDIDETAVNDAVDFVFKMLDRAHEKGRMSEAELAGSKDCVSNSSDLKNLSEVDLVIEAIVENIDVKQSLFKELEAIVSEECILATNTSSLSVTAVAANCVKPDRVAGFHFFNPVPLMKLVEVITAMRTSPDVALQLQALTKRLGHTPVMVDDSPGFLVNHSGRGLITEGLRILHENITDIQTVDEVMRDCVDFRMGPFELMDLTGLDVTFPASEQVYNQYFQEPRLRPTPLQRRRYIAGLLGRKTKQGFYRYEDGNKIVGEEKSIPIVELSSAFWISPDNAELSAKLRKVLQESGAQIDEAKRPGENSIAIVTPLGLDTTTAVINENLPAHRTIAIDALFNMDKRLTLMSSPATSEAVISESWAAFAKTCRVISVIRDSGGFIAQRIIACIVNIACDIAQQGIAKPEDIDIGARLGLAYPQGPLALGDAIGMHNILTILENLQVVYGDPRYRPSPWLRRRAQLGLSLLQEEM